MFINYLFICKILQKYAIKILTAIIIAKHQMIKIIAI